ncbi:hypothetical protein [Povalibacter sp.]|uniref:hypothetical protein n=1 Tax=Povalibacter sp. TaxID=1962978 RepID=UPI002F40F0E7
MQIEPAVFADVPLNANERIACSPPEPAAPDWRGIVIRAPNRVYFKAGETVGDHGAFAAVPICGFFMAQASVQGVSEPMKLVAVDRSSGKSYSGPIVELDSSPDEPPPVEDEPYEPQSLQGLASGGYFNPNLIDFVALPARSAMYTVHVELRDYRSNPVDIELIER